MQELRFVAQKEDAGKRLDVFLSEKNADLTRSRLKKLIDAGHILVNGETEKAGRALKGGDEILVTVPDAEPVEAVPCDIPVEIVYEDDDLAVVNKPQGLTVHAGNGTGKDTLVGALLFRLDHLSGVGGKLRPGIVHRIDKNTSGLLVVAKNDAAHLSLSAQIAKKTCKRKYFALLEGELKTETGRIETYIARDPKHRTLYKVSASEGRKAVTDYRVIERFEGYTLAEFSLQTGRTHQIRVHAKYLGHPVVGDPEYGYIKQKFSLKGQLLHAHELTFVHPKTGETMTFTAPLPDHFEAVLIKLRKKK